MEVKVQIPFQELVTVIRQLSPGQKAKLQKELAGEQANPVKKSAKNPKLTELLLNGPVFTDTQIKIIEETRKSINLWRTQS